MTERALLVAPKYLDTCIVKLKETHSRYNSLSADVEQRTAVTQEVEATLAHYEAWMAAARSLNVDDLYHNIISKVHESIKNALYSVESSLNPIFSSHLDNVLQDSAAFTAWSDDKEGVKVKLRKSCKKQLEDELASRLFTSEFLHWILESVETQVQERIKTLSTTVLSHLLSKSEKEFSKWVVEEKNSIQTLIDSLPPPTQETQADASQQPVDMNARQTSGRNATLVADLNRMLATPAAPKTSEQAEFSRDGEGEDTHDDALQRSQYGQDDFHKQSGAVPPQLPPRTDLETSASSLNANVTALMSVENEQDKAEKKKKGGFKAFFGLSKNKNKKSSKNAENAAHDDQIATDGDMAHDEHEQEHASEETAHQIPRKSVEYGDAKSNDLGHRASSASYSPVDSPERAIPLVPPRQSMSSHAGTEHSLPSFYGNDSFTEHASDVPRPVARAAPPVPRRKAPALELSEQGRISTSYEDQEVSTASHEEAEERTEEPTPPVRPMKKLPGAVALPGHGAISALAMAVTGRPGPAVVPGKPKVLMTASPSSPEFTRDEPESAGSEVSSPVQAPAVLPTTAPPVKAKPPPPPVAARKPKTAQPSSASLETERVEAESAYITPAQIRMVQAAEMTLLAEPLIIKKKENSTSGDDKAIEKNAIDWLNAHLVDEGSSVTNLYKDLGDGLKLIQALEHASGESVGKYNKRIMLPVHKIDNLAVALRFLEKKGIPVDFLNPNDIANEDHGKILTLFNYIIKQFS